MGLFSSNRETVADEFAAPAAPQQLQMPQTPEEIEQFVRSRAIVEAQLGDSSASRIAALKLLKDLMLVDETTKYKADMASKSMPNNQIIIVQERLAAAKAKTLQQSNLLARPEPLDANG